MINARDQRAAARDARQQQAAALVAEVAADGGHVDGGAPGQGPIPVPGGQAQAAPMIMDPGLWLNMVNIKPPQLADLEIESMKKFILDHKRYDQKCPEQLRRRMQHFILEDHLDVMAELP